MNNHKLPFHFSDGSADGAPKFAIAKSGSSKLSMLPSPLSSLNWPLTTDLGSGTGCVDVAHTLRITARAVVQKYLQLPGVRRIVRPSRDRQIQCVIAIEVTDDDGVRKQTLVGRITGRENPPFPSLKSIETPGDLEIHNDNVWPVLPVQVARVDRVGATYRQRAIAPVWINGIRFCRGQAALGIVQEYRHTVVSGISNCDIYRAISIEVGGSNCTRFSQQRTQIHILAGETLVNRICLLCISGLDDDDLVVRLRGSVHGTSTFPFRQSQRYPDRRPGSSSSSRTIPGLCRETA